MSINDSIDERTAPTINVVTVAFRNSTDEVRRLVESLRLAGESAGFGVSITVVANDDADFSDLSTDCMLVQGHGNVGFGRGVRRGVTAVPSDYVIVVNPDCEVAPDDIAPVMQALTPGCGVLVPVLEKSPGVIDVNLYQSWVFTPMRHVSRLACRWFLQQSSSEKIPRLVKAPGTFLAMQTGIAVEMGPFDDGFFLYGEDRDFTFRARRARIPLHLVRGARVLHPGGQSGKSVAELVARSRADSMLRIAHRRYGAVGLVLMKANLLSEAWIKDRLRGTNTLPSRRWATRRWKGGRAAVPLGVDAGLGASFGAETHNREHEQ